ncbi:hypothetical protein BpHYR1_023144 [Brachionus plicatilis]|uniref:Uncharacterized protein n=1 Tax=Brachionus plicatilis TaxID=10195 RepID=A0A3M7S9H6_BRAPC|nr:hypothetical protein BpHYR1_023144 [Brachionus plicatilis]
MALHKYINARLNSYLFFKNIIRFLLGLRLRKSGINSVFDTKSGDLLIRIRVFWMTDRTSMLQMINSFAVPSIKLKSTSLSSFQDLNPSQNSKETSINPLGQSNAVKKNYLEVITFCKLSFVEPCIFGELNESTWAMNKLVGK